MRERIIVAGVGGQGILLAGKLVIRAGMEKNLNVTYIPSYGAEVRGGTAHCHLIVSEEEIASPIIEHPDFALVLNTPSLIKFSARVETGGIVICNRSLADPGRVSSSGTIIGIPATEMAETLGSAKVANMVMLGAFLRRSRLLDPDTLKETLIRFLPGRHRDLLEANLKALEQGYDFEP
ncbi:MAG TPA: 2-oxoacid:acceptor oxidoreductase family protein [bacterium]|nr:2-oxoacid:acceptor oxidoreductase family protein [bacterium]